ncbi:DUF3325 domain-containing protein [Paraburkholderia dinghuensis]|uniref:DUF3325 domain-containing protein n=1 Tax=Paraburkholderia dinghuensis TaxID=2305225 RepID=A0A3N6P730_9BURK|nr:DUF3325 domain-containing protein [Paraburkholderia dinghuensis]RQH09823.1 DUF3325 domain-containing protein [Paraburkholderia dinghuensis]
MMRLLALLLCVGAFGCLAMAMARHQEALLGRALPAAHSRCLRGAGGCSLGIALAFVVADQGWALGLVAFSGSTSVAAGTVYGALIAWGRWSDAS